MRTFEECIAKLPSSVQLYYVDYNCNLDESPALLSKIVEDDSTDALYDDICLCGDLNSAAWEMVEKDFGLTEDEIDEYGERIVDVLYERNDVLETLYEIMGNTARQCCYYELGGEDYRAICWEGEEYFEQRLEDIKFILGLRGNSQDERIMELISEAFYGGKLVIWFRDDVSNLITNTCAMDDFRQIVFSGEVCLAIINTHNGSGFEMRIKLEQPLELDFCRANLRLNAMDKCEPYLYDYVDSTCGLVHSFCDFTTVHLLTAEQYEKKQIMNAVMAGLVNEYIYTE